MPVLETTGLDVLLAENVDAAFQREQSAFDQEAAPFQSTLVLFGAGAFGRHILTRLRRAGIEPVAFADNQPRLWGGDVDGVPVLAPADAARSYGNSAAFVVTIWNGRSADHMADRVQQLISLGCRRVLTAPLLFWKYPEVFLPHYSLDLPHKLLERASEVREVNGFWADEASRREYTAQIAFRLLADFDGLGGPAPQSYFPEDLVQLTPDEVLIDCGAFDGDTIRSFVSLRGYEFHGLVAFEPDPLNWTKLQDTIALLPPNVAAKVECRAQAVGARTETVSFGSTGTDLSAVGAGSLAVECVSLDDCLREPPTLIKFDVEGFELEALAGAREIIRRHRPILAVSAYHRQSHLWEIPLAIRSLTDGYRYFLRAHGTEAWDVVCYAIPPHRMPGGSV